jgi:SAM-dependent methyltransferase
MDRVQAFYDNLAASYHFIFVDWQQAVQRQASILRTFLEKQGASPPQSVLDCTCGIGTQAIALATQGYRVHGTDLSPKAIEQASVYAQQFELPQPINFTVADLLKPPEQPVIYDVVLSCDNAVAHFHSMETLAQALATMKMQLKAGGLLVISLRDYDTAVANPKRTMPENITDGDAGRRIVFQVWDWAEDLSAYHLQLFIIQQQGEQWHTEMHASHLRAWQRADITKALENAGLLDITWHMPEASGYYQPIVTARKA